MSCYRATASRYGTEVHILVSTKAHANTKPGETEMMDEKEIHVRTNCGSRLSANQTIHCFQLLSILGSFFTHPLNLVVYGSFQNTLQESLIIDISSGERLSVDHNC